MLRFGCAARFARAQIIDKMTSCHSLADRIDRARRQGSNRSINRHQAFGRGRDGVPPQEEIAMPGAKKSHDVSISIHADRTTGPYRPLWHWFGYDEPNY